MKLAALVLTACVASASCVVHVAAIAPTNTAPRPNAHGLERTQQIAIQFDDTIGSCATGAVQIRGRLIARYPVSVTWTGATATVSPTEPYLPGDDIVLLVTTGVTSMAGHPASPRQFWFSVGATACSNFQLRVMPLTTNAAFTYTTLPADLDGDRDVDIVAIASATGFTVYLNNGNGSFFTGQTYAETVRGAGVLSDINNDSRFDLVAQDGEQNLVLLTNSMPGEYHLHARISAGATFPGSGDIDGDGWTDILAGHSNAIVLRNLGDGSFATNQVLRAHSFAWSLSVRDLNGDHVGDLSLEGWPFGTLYPGTTNGTFSTNSPQVSSPVAFPVGYADLNGDGAADVVSGGYTATSRILTNDGVGFFSVIQSLPSVSAMGIVTVDLDGDTDLDVMRAAMQPVTGSILMNTGSGILSSSVVAWTTNPVTSLHSADFDGDGDLDFVTSEVGQPPIIYFQYNCAETNDVDGDGLPTDIEVNSGMNPTDASDATEDMDADGQTAFQEYIAGTRINDPESFFRIDGVGESRVIFSGVAGRWYSTEYCDALDVWLPLETLEATNSGPIGVVDPTPAAQRIYRVRVSYPH